MKRSIVNCFVQFLCLVIVFQVAYTLGKECGDPQCKSVIALGRAVMNFRGGGGQKVNLEQNESLEILAKNVGKDKDFFVRTSKGKEGLAAKQFIQESSIVIKKADRLWFKDDIPRVDLDPIKSTPSTVSGNGVEQEIVVDGAVLTNDVPNSLTPKVPIENAHANAEPIPSLEVVPNSQAPKGEETNEQYVADDENGKEENIESGEELNNEEEYDDEEAEDISDEDEDEIQEDQSEETKLMKKVDFITHHNDTAKDFTQKEQAGDSSRMTSSKEESQETLAHISNLDQKQKLTATKNDLESLTALRESSEKTHSKAESQEILQYESNLEEKQELSDKQNNIENPTALRDSFGKTHSKAENQETLQYESNLDQKQKQNNIDNYAVMHDFISDKQEISNQKTHLIQGVNNLEHDVSSTAPEETENPLKAAITYVSNTQETKNESFEEVQNIEHAGAIKLSKDTKEAISSTDKPVLLDSKSIPNVDMLPEEFFTSDYSQNVFTTESSVLVNDETAASAAIYPDIFETVTPVETTADNINPVTIEPALNTLETVASSDNQPTHPSRILAGGLGNILAHGHLHHHGHHHHHHGSHSHHDHANDNHHYATQDKQTTPEVDPVMSNAQSDDDKHLRHVVEQAKPDQDDKDSLNKDADLVELSTPLTPVEHEPTGFNDKVLMDNEYCENDVTDCSPIAAFVPPSIQHSNGDADYMNSLAKHPMEETVKRNGGGIEELQDDGNKQQDFLSFEQQPIGYYLEVFVQEALRLSDLILMLMITSFTLLMFSLGHYLINKNRQDKRLIYNLNLAERDLMTSYKEITLLKNELQDTKHKLVSIENNSFGSNDMVMALKAELETAEQVKLEMQDQISGLEKELENAAEAGLELNKMVAELLNQNGSNSIALSVEELQRQLNEQQQTILSMNVSLAEKSRENSQLQINLSNQASKFKDRLEDMERANTELIEHRSQLQQQIDQLKHEKLTSLNNLRQETSVEIERLTKEVKIFQGKADEGRKAFAVAQAKCEALEQCLKESKTVTGTSGMQIIDSIELKTQIALITKEKTDIQDKLQGEIIARQLVEDHMKMVNEEISTLKRDFSTIEKDKLEAETRLQVLSSYFKDKETQLQKELSVKEAMWMQQQGETTSTVEKIRHMQDEIQQLKSQNDKLRAEIEAQATAHKAQYTTLETRSHDAWLAARQAERRLEEARSESSALRRKLTALGEISTTSDGLPNASITQTDLGLTAPSPIRVESPNVSSLLGVLPPPRFMPPFMPGPPPPFMTPFMPPPHGPGEMRPPPLGRLMSPPPPPNNRYSPNSIIDTRGRYSPDRGRYSPDSRYDYSVMSTYETENDFSPPPSPPHHSRHANYDRDRDRDRNRVNDRERPHREGRSSGGYSRDFTPTGMRTSPPIQDPRNKKYAGDFSSGSQDSLGTRKSSGKYKTTGKSPS